MADLSNLKIPIFTDINDIPTPPTTSTGQNISYSNARHNDLIDELQIVIDDLTARIENLETNSSGSTTNTTDTFDFTIPVGSGSIALGNANPGYLARYSIEGVTANDDVTLDLDGTGYIVGIANTQDFGTGIEYSPDNPSYDILANDTLHLVYNDFTEAKQVTLYLEYQ